MNVASLVVVFLDNFATGGLVNGNLLHFLWDSVDLLRFVSSNRCDLDRR
jgi:hypothetical protein